MSVLKILGSEVPRSTAVLCPDSLSARPRGATLTSRRTKRLLNLAKQSDAIGSPLSQPDRRVHKKVHLHNDARARDLPELHWCVARRRRRREKMPHLAAAALRCPLPRPIPDAVWPSPPQYRRAAGVER